MGPRSARPCRCPPRHLVGGMGRLPASPVHPDLAGEDGGDPGDEGLLVTPGLEEREVDVALPVGDRDVEHLPATLLHPACATCLHLRHRHDVHAVVQRRQVGGVLEVSPRPELEQVPHGVQVAGLRQGARRARPEQGREPWSTRRPRLLDSQEQVVERLPAVNDTSSPGARADPAGEVVGAWRRVGTRHDRDGLPPLERSRRITSAAASSMSSPMRTMSPPTTPRTSPRRHGPALVSASLLASVTAP